MPSLFGLMAQLCQEHPVHELTYPFAAPAHALPEVLVEQEVRYLVVVHAYRPPQRHVAGDKKLKKIVLAVLVRPWLWRSLMRFAPPGWWRHWPPNPMPPKEYIDFRLLTAYGDTDARPTAEEVVLYLAWCRRMAKERRTW